MNSLRILIYGIDKYTEFVISSINRANIIVGISDSYSRLSSFGDLRFVKDIDKVEFDFVIITARDRGIRDNVLNSLLDKGIPQKKIISFFEIFHEEKVTKVLKRNKNTLLNGIIIGLSHSAYGINPKYLDGNWANLATSSEDLFYHKEVLKKCFGQYKRNLRKLEYIIIDMYDYHFFSVDTSRSSNALFYWIFGGIPKLHNYLSNSFFGSDIEEEMAAKYYNYPAYFPERKKEDLVLRAEIFDEDSVFSSIGKYYTDIGPMNSGYDDFPNEFSNGGHIDKVPNIPATAYLKLSADPKLYLETERENKKILREIISLIKKEAPNTKIILTLLPRYKSLEDLHSDSNYMISERIKFIKELESIIDDKSVFFLNLKSEITISDNFYLYRDSQHLNYQGSIALTSIYNNYLRDIRNKG